MKLLRGAVRAAGLEAARLSSGDVILAKRNMPWEDRRSPLDSYLLEAELSSVLDRRRVELVIDVGANYGQFGQGLRAAGYAGRIVSYEPIPHVAATLRAATETDGAWRVVEAAVGSKPGVSTLHVAASTDFSSLLRPSDEGKRFADSMRETDEIEVRVVTLDDEWPTIAGGTNPERTMLKIDTQGFDHAVLMGAPALMVAVAVVLLELPMIRIYDGAVHYVDTLRLAEGAGLGVSRVAPVTTEPATNRVIEADCLLVRPAA